MAESTTTPTITYTDVINHLKNGVTRKVNDKGYDPERGSIEEKYNLSKADVTRLFKHPALIGKKVIIPKKEAFIFVDDRPLEEAEAPEQKYGAPTKTAMARMDKEAIENPVEEGAMEAADDAAIMTEVDEEAMAAASADIAEEVASEEVEEDIF